MALAGRPPPRVPAGGTTTISVEALARFSCSADDREARRQRGNAAGPAYPGAASARRAAARSEGT